MYRYVLLHAVNMNHRLTALRERVFTRVHHVPIHLLRTFMLRTLRDATNTR
jgi:hypothetical protein